MRMLIAARMHEFIESTITNSSKQILAEITKAAHQVVNATHYVTPCTASINQFGSLLFLTN
jgi:hypothetical protein